MEVEEKAKKEIVIDVYPLNKGKRALTLLADVFTLFILSMLLFHFAVYPVGQIIFKQEEKNQEYATAMTNRDKVLFRYDLLFAKEGEASPTLENSLDHTADCFVSYYAMDSAKNQNVLWNYYVSIAADNASYISLFTNNEVGKTYFDITNGTVTLKQEKKELIAPYFDKKDTLSKSGESALKAIKDDFFAPSYSSLLKEIKQKDLIFEGISFKTSQEKIEELDTSQNYLIVACVYFAYFVASLLICLLPPFFNKDNKTVVNMFLRQQVIDKRGLRLWKMKHILANYPLRLLEGAGLLFFAPLPMLFFNELFSLPILLPVSGVSLLFLLVSLVYVIFDPFNRVPSDILSGTLMISNDMLDQIYRSRGYDI